MIAHHILKTSRSTLTRKTNHTRCIHSLVAILLAITAIPQNGMATKQTSTKRVERNYSDWTVESNTGWESGDDDDEDDGECTIDLNPTDHLIEGFCLSKNASNHKFPCFSTKTKMKLKNPWRKPDIIKRTDGVAIAKHKPGENISNKEKNAIRSSGRDIPRIVKTASIRDKEMFRIAAKDAVRSAGKRLSHASRDKVVVKPSSGPHKGDNLVRLRTETRIEATYESNDTTTTATITTAKHVEVGQEVTSTRSEHSSCTSTAASTSKILTMTDRLRSIDTPSQRELPQKVPSYLQKMWQKQRMANSKIVLQCVIWKVQVDELSKPPSLQPWISVGPGVQSEAIRECSRTVQNN